MYLTGCIPASVYLAQTGSSSSGQAPRCSERAAQDWPRKQSPALGHTHAAGASSFFQKGNPAVRMRCPDFCRVSSTRTRSRGRQKSSACAQQARCEGLFDAGRDKAPPRPEIRVCSLSGQAPTGRLGPPLFALVQYTTRFRINRNLEASQRVIDLAKPVEQLRPGDTLFPRQPEIGRDRLGPRNCLLTAGKRPAESSPFARARILLAHWHDCA